MILSENNNKNKIYSFLVKNFDYFILIFVFFFAYFIYSYYFKGILIEINEVETQKINLEQENYREQENYLKKLQEAKGGLERINIEDLKKVNLILPEEDQKKELFHYIDKLVKENQMNLQFIKFSNLEHRNYNENKILTDQYYIADKVSRLKIDMRVSGVNYDRLKLLLNSIENNLRLMDVEFFNFSSLDNGELNLSIIAYYEPQEPI
jgi:hypothetical protein